MMLHHGELRLDAPWLEEREGGHVGKVRLHPGSQYQSSKFSLKGSGGRETHSTSYRSSDMFKASHTLWTDIPPATRSRWPRVMSTLVGDCGRVWASCEGYMMREKMGALVGWASAAASWGVGEDGAAGPASDPETGSRGSAPSWVAGETAD